MASGYISKNDFIRAYQWAYGTLKKEAEYIWSIASYEYKVEIIRGAQTLAKSHSTTIELNNLSTCSITECG